LAEAGMSEITRGSILSLIIVSMLLTQNFAVEAQEIKKSGALAFW
jgi:hypothetical protein